MSLKFATVSAVDALTELQDLVVATSSGLVLRLGDLNLLAIEQVLQEDPRDALRSIMQKIRVQRVDAGQLGTNQQSILLVRIFCKNEC